MKGQHEQWLCRCVSGSQVRAFLTMVWAINGALALGNILLVAGWRPPVNTIAAQIRLNNEATFSAWYPSMLLMLLGLATLLQFAASHQGAGAGGGKACYGWLALAFLATALSVTEVAMLHEVLGNSYAKYVGHTVFGMRTQWPILLSPFIIASVVLLVRFFRGELARVPGVAPVAFAGLAVWVSVIALELLEWTVLLAPGLRGIRAFEPTFEEMCELAGTTLLLTAALRFGFATSKPSPEALDTAAAPVK
ncbi:MAG: hypothetical protein HY321_05195 [Armatimonadetes bacterium]|nr:hypothetical protein [Armatimonadota bacterium]